MITIRKTTLGLFMSLAVFAAAACVQQNGTTPSTTTNTNSTSQASPAASATNSSKTVPVTLPVLDALFSDDAFRTTLKSKVELTDEQLTQLRKIASDEVAKLRSEEHTSELQSRFGISYAVF